ncbi:MAG: hypothetical protein IBJ10_08840, partial [Phycisphaerales bacterium]|nr:hypothetical protein [Phycisphaerales bacterium]
MTRTTHRAIIVRAALAGALLVAAAAIAQNALDAALDANTRVGGTGYNPGGRGNAASLRASSFRLDRGTGEVRDAFGGNSAFSRPEYRVSMSGAGARGAAARAGLTRDQVYPSTQANLRQDDVQRRMQGGGFAPNDFRGANRAGGLQTPVYQPYSST